MTETATGRHSPADGPLIDTRREIRLALVMYGGVSLAIYMNGVSQELFHLVRATAPKRLRDPESVEPLVPTEELSGTEAVYRKLGQALEDLAADPHAPLAAVDPGKAISTRFVIDILSGSSAGGINAVFLAKALANEQSIDELQLLWMEQGNISVLLNDEKSKVPGLTLERPPQSLLNSGRMYGKLLDAFDSMEATNPNDGACRSPYVLELDLWVTTTDLRGVTLPLQLSRGVEFERRYRNVFHFVYGTLEASGADRNDFLGKNNPMFALAARCTSAFPFAFKPMTFQDIAEKLSLHGAYRGVDLAGHPWKEFYRDYFPAPPPGSSLPADLDPEQQLPFNHRPFADGGALDNKPFTWATDTLLRRRADVPVDRKLIFIEPDPGHPESETTKQDRPNALQNFELQGVSLPRQETIRQDLQAVLDRNRTIERVEHILQGLAKDVFEAADGESAASKEWADQDITAGLARYGGGYGGYHRLKVAVVTDDLSSLVTSVAGFDDDSDEFLAVRYLIRKWRDEHYDHYAGSKRTFNTFLLEYDLQHRLRRLNFLRTRADALYRLDDDARDVIGHVPGARVPSGDEIVEFQDEFRRAKRALSDIFVKLRFLGRQLRSHGRSPLLADLAKLGIKREDLLELIGPASEQDRNKAVDALYDLKGKTFEGLAANLAVLVRNGIPGPDDEPATEPRMHPYGTEQAADDLAKALAADGALSPGAATARSVLRAYADHFDDFDMVAFPMLYGTDAGEADYVEIIRIAPEDAPSIFDERGSNYTVRKTRGWKYSHFGAFLDADWRRNDILFGRLDAAECLANALVPATHPDLKRLLQQAQRAIIVDSLSPERQKMILGSESPVDLSDEEVVERFRRNYRVSDALPAGEGLPIMARGIDVSGKVLRGIADEGGAKSPLGWVARLGALLTTMAGVLVPGSRQARTFGIVAALLVLIEAVMIVLGFAFWTPLAIIGVVALVLTLAVVVLVYLVRRSIRGKR